MALAVVHPTERSGLHTFWSARWAALQDAGIDLNLLLPAELSGYVPSGIPAPNVKYAPMRRPRTLTHIRNNIEYVANLRDEAEAFIKVIGDIQGDVIMSHGPHFLTAAVAARRSDLPLAILLHSAAAPAWSARALCAIRRPAVVAYELPSLIDRFSPLFRNTYSFQLAPVLSGGFEDQRYEPSVKARVGFVASFSPRKRVDKFLDLVENSDSSAFDFRLIGSVAAGHLRWWREELQPRVDTLTEADRLTLVDGTHGVAAAMQSLDVLVITSDDEGIPNVAMEALSVGATVVSLQLEGLDVLRQRIPPELRSAIRQVQRGPREIPQVREQLAKVGEVPRQEIAKSLRAATAPTLAAHEIATALTAVLITTNN